MTVMKIKSHTLALCMIFSCHYPQAYSESSLPTSEANIDTTTSAAQSVLICRLTDLGWVDFKGPSTTAYDEAKFEVIKTLKGDPITRIVCSLLVLAPPLEANEKAPQVGENYIVIGNHIEGKFTLKKFLSATPDNIRKVQNLLSHSALTVGVSVASATKSQPEHLQKAAESKATAPMNKSPTKVPTSPPTCIILTMLAMSAGGLLWMSLKR